MEAGRKIRVQPRVITEVTESQMGQMHGDKMNCAARIRELFQPKSDSDVEFGLWPNNRATGSTLQLETVFITHGSRA